MHAGPYSRQYDNSAAIGAAGLLGHSYSCLFSSGRRKKCIRFVVYFCLWLNPLHVKDSSQLRELRGWFQKTAGLDISRTNSWYSMYKDRAHSLTSRHLGQVVPKTRGVSLLMLSSFLIFKFPEIWLGSVLILNLCGGGRELFSASWGRHARKGLNTTGLVIYY